MPGLLRPRSWRPPLPWPPGGPRPKNRVYSFRIEYILFLYVRYIRMIREADFRPVREAGIGKSGGSTRADSTVSFQNLMFVFAA